MNWILKIAPGRLKLIDVYLRENYPWIWATRVHFTLYATILLGAFAALIGVITPVDIQKPMSDNDIMSFFGVFMFPTIIFMGYIIFQLCLFSVEKRKGKSNYFRPLIVFPLMMFSVLSPLIMPFSVAFVLNTKTANLALEEQVNSDSIELRKAKYFINTGEGDYKFFASERAYRQYWEKNIEGSQYSIDTRNEKEQAIYFHEGKYRASRPRLYKAKTYSSYYGYNSGWSPIETVKADVMQFYHDQNLNLSLLQAEKYLIHINECIEKYSRHHPLKLDSILYELRNNIYTDCYSNTKKDRRDYSYDYEQKVRKVFHKASNNLDNISRAQDTHVPGDSLFVFLGFLWASFIISLLLFIFRHVHWKQFLLSILIIGIYLTLIGIIEGVGDFNGDFFPIMAILFVIVSMIIFNKAWGLKNFSVAINQMAIVTFTSLAFFPIMILGYLEEVWDIFEIDYFDKYLIQDINEYRPYSQEYYDLIDSIWLITFWSGIVFFYLIGLPYLKKVFLRLMSLPKKN